jgi:tRNA A-37 threonylcarbamoyl transferase component Bud32
MIGNRIAHFEVEEILGRGGMGVVYKARDTRLNRSVALKFLPAHTVTSDESRVRFLREAQMAAALSHPNIAAVYDLGETDDKQVFIVMELIAGETLSDALESERLPLERAIEIGVQIASGLQAAHESGIVHRDVKPSNIMLSNTGTAKILDFGLSKLAGSQVLTKTGSTLGTASYMSPEQVRGEDVDFRTDIWSLGVVLYQLLCGRLPFEGTYEAAIAYAILNTEADSVATTNPDVPERIPEIVERAMQKDADARYGSMADFRDDLDAFAKGTLHPVAPARSQTAGSRTRMIVGAVAIVAAVSVIALWWADRNAKKQWAAQVALPEIEQLANAENWREAFVLAREAEPYLGADSALIRLWPQFSSPVNISTDPPGATVFVRPYADLTADWEPIGQTPLKDYAYPRGWNRIRVAKEGYDVFEVATGRWSRSVDVDIRLADPDGSVRVPARGDDDWYLLPVGLDHLGFEPLEAFQIDRFEVSNGEFKAFVDGGGYRSRDYWKIPIESAGRTMTWEDAMRLFVDRTGQHGPSTWEVQDYPDGQENFPVTGVSWYEAAAYAEFVGKRLPTLFHWATAANILWSSELVPLSNLVSDSPAAVGSHEGMSPNGAYDLAGNAREWIWNASGDREKRYLLGGGWDDPDYAFTDAFALDALDRSSTNGFRCIKYLEANDNQEALERPLARAFRDYYAERPASDTEFEGFLRQYAYDRSPLNAKVEETVDSHEDWIKQKITFDAAYGNERVIAYLFLPRNAVAPFQTVVFFPGSGAISRTTSDDLSPGSWDFILKSGRAYLHPIYKSTYERADDIKSDYGDESVYYRSRVIMWANDLSRSIDYLQTRDDIDSDRLAYLGYSWGGASGPIMTVVEPRFKASVLYVAGLYPSTVSPEVDPFNFIPRIKTPTLMLNGKYDFFYPYETSQKPFYEQLTLPDDEKEFYVSDGSHYVLREELVSRTLAWLDRFVGSVR